MLRKALLAAALSAASVLGVSSAASAHSSAGITFSFGSSGGYYDGSDPYGYGYDTPYYNQGYYGNNGGYDQSYYNQYYRNYWAQRQRQIQLQRWQRQRQIEQWRYQQNERRHWQHDRYDHGHHDDHEDDGD